MDLPSTRAQPVLISRHEVAGANRPRDFERAHVARHSGPADTAPVPVHTVAHSRRCGAGTTRPTADRHQSPRDQALNSDQVAVAAVPAGAMVRREHGFRHCPARVKDVEALQHPSPARDPRGTHPCCRSARELVGTALAEAPAALATHQRRTSGHRRARRRAIGSLWMDPHGHVLARH